MGTEVSQESGHALPQPGADVGAGPAVRGVPISGAVGLPTKGQPSAHSWPEQIDNMTEGMLMAHLTRHLASRPKCSLLLCDLGALLSAQLRASVKERGGLRTWIQKYPMLFEVTGQPGKESVTLLVGANAFGSMEGVAPQHAKLECPRQDATTVSAEERKEIQEEEDMAASLQLRGLPYRASDADIKAFLGRHATNLRDENSVHLISNRDGRPSGFARAEFTSPAAARAARNELHKAIMRTSEASGAVQERYIEIFLYSERPTKLRFKKGMQIALGAAPANGEDMIPQVNLDTVINDVRQHMVGLGKSQLLLSMLGVALSPSSRQFLKKTDLGLKHFLLQLPREFTVEGAKGREYITYLPLRAQVAPAGAKSANPVPTIPASSCTSIGTSSAAAPLASAPVSSSVEPDSLPASNTRQKKAPKGTPGPSSGNLNELGHNAIMEELLAIGQQSPTRVPVSPGLAAIRGLRTPSDWGTPQPYEMTHTKHRQPVESQKQPNNFASFPMLSSSEAPPMNGYFAVGPLNMVPWTGFAVPVSMPGAPLNLPGGPITDPPWLAAGDHCVPPSMPSAPWTFQNVPFNVGAAPGFGEVVGPPTPSDINITGLMQKLGVASPQAVPTSSAPAGKEHIEPTNELRLRGLPFASTIQDIFAFFAKHDVVENIADVDHAVKLIMKPGGKASGHAVVLMRGEAEAKQAQSLLHGQWMGSRYIEVFSNDEGGHAMDAETQAANQDTSNELDDVTSVLGDTGGSGGMLPLPLIADPAVCGQEPRWSDTSYNIVMAPEKTAMPLDGIVAGTGGECAPLNQSESTWSALYDFLKQDTTSATNQFPEYCGVERAPGTIYMTGM